jgi:hypothetical protein
MSANVIKQHRGKYGTMDAPAERTAAANEAKPGDRMRGSTTQLLF